MWTFTNGVTSAWLEPFGLDLNDLTVLSDSDFDGLANWEENVAGTVPTNDASGLWFSSVVPGLDSIVMRWPAVSGRTYNLYATSNLVEGAWELEQADLPYSVPLGVTTVQVGETLEYFSVTVE